MCTYTYTHVYIYIYIFCVFGWNKSYAVHGRKGTPPSDSCAHYNMHRPFFEFSRSPIGYNAAHTTPPTITRDSNNNILLHNVLLVVIMIHFTSASPNDFISEATADVRSDCRHPPVVYSLRYQEFIISNKIRFGNYTSYIVIVVQVWYSNKSFYP